MNDTEHELAAFIQANLPDSAAAVRRGVALLDEQQPDWWQKINPDTLEIRSGTLCVLGQIYGTYAAGGEVLGWPKAGAHGFALDVSWLDLDQLPGWNPSWKGIGFGSVWPAATNAFDQHLADAWREAIAAKRQEAAAA